MFGKGYLVHNCNGEVRLLLQGVALGTKLALSQELLACNHDTIHTRKNFRSTKSLIQLGCHLQGHRQSTLSQ